MKENEEKDLEKSNELSVQNETHEVSSDEKALNANELFAIEGGEYEDLDEDCSALECLVGASIYCVFSS